MDPTKWRQLERWFEEAMRLSTSERDVLLARVKAGDPEIHAELCSLIQAEASSDSFWDVPLFDSRIKIGASIGPYRVLKVLGQGGMGAVYLAQQKDAPEHRVALKVMAMAALDAVSYQRFQAEQRLLARMSHSYIAKLHACGITESGLPYFVMEYVEGTNLTEYCATKRLTLEQRLELFQKLCEAVSHAHLKGVVHRDLKPHNILVIEEDGAPIPKIIDFGIAKPMEATRHLTQLGEKPGTYRYMSPEQAGLRDNQNRPLDVDARSDVYALGVILYELLLGEAPLTWEAGTPSPRYLEDICRKDIPHLMSKWRALNPDQHRSLARSRRESPRTLEKVFRSDLNWVLQKALAKNPDQRYRTPDQLADDVTRAQRHQAVRARQPGMLYLSTKFLRRYRLAISLAATMILFLTGLLAVLVIMQRRTVVQRDTAEQVIALLTDMFESADPYRRDFIFPTEEVSGYGLEAVLERGTRTIQSHLHDQPKARARLMHTLGAIYIKLGKYDRAEGLLRDAVRIRRAELGPRNPQVAESMVMLAIWHQAQAHFDEAEQILAEALAIRQSNMRDPTAEWVDIKIQMASIHKARGDLERAETDYRKILNRFNPKLEKDFRVYATCLNNLALLVKERGDLEDAQCLLRHTMDLDRTYFGEGHPNLAHTLHNLAMLYYNLDDFPKAEWYYREALKLRQERLREDHPDVALSLNGLALTMQAIGHFEEAFRLHARCLEIRRRIYGESHPRVATALHNLGFTLHGMGDLESAASYYDQALAMRRHLFGDRHHEVAISLHNLAYIYSETGRPAEAEPLFLEAIRTASAILGQKNHSVAAFKRNLANHYFRYGRYVEAEPLLAEAIAARRLTLGEKHPRVAHALCLAAETQMHLGQWAKARHYLEEALDIYRQAPPGDWRAAYARALWGVFLYREGSPLKGAARMQKGIEALTIAKGATHEATHRLNKWSAAIERPNPILLESDPHTEKLLSQND